jgi:hypothetical protein
MHFSTADDDTGDDAPFVGVFLDAPSGSPSTGQLGLVAAPLVVAAPTPVALSISDATTIRVTIPPFFIAMTSLGATTKNPNDKAYERLVNAMQAYFTSVLANTNGADLMEMDLKLYYTHFGLGIPMEQYNLLMEFEASATFQMSSVSTPLAQDLFILLRDSMTPEVVWSVGGTAFANITEVFLAKTTATL